MSGAANAEVPNDVDPEMVSYAYSSLSEILSTQRESSQDLNKKAANLMQLLSVVLGLYAGSLTLAVEVIVAPETEIGYSDFVTEYLAGSGMFLAVGFIYAILAYHETDIKTAPEPDRLVEMIEKSTVLEAQYEFNQKFPTWISDNREELRADHTRLFNCKMCIFFSLVYFVLGAILLMVEPDVGARAIIGLVILFATYQVYGTIRVWASS